MKNKAHVLIGAGLSRDNADDLEGMIQVIALISCLLSGQSESHSCYDNKALSEVLNFIHGRLKYIHQEIYDLPLGTLYAIENGVITKEINTDNH